MNDVWNVPDKVPENYSFLLKEGGSLNEDTAAIRGDIGKSVLFFAQWHHDIKTTWLHFHVP